MEAVKDVKEPPPARSPTPPPPTPAASTEKSKGNARTVITETEGKIIDENGETIWICPACKRRDDGSPMIGCDLCDDWYHWECVGITKEPSADQWFCTRCSSTNKPKKGRKKPARKKGGKKK